MEEQKPLTSVHEALHKAALASKPLPGKPVSFRLEDELKNVAMEICERHGTTLSEFLRQCAIGLVHDYSDPSRG